MSLGNFAEVMNFALDLEAMAAAFYETATTITHNQELKSLFEAFLLQGQGHVQLLIQTRRTATTKKANQRFWGIQSQNYIPNTECPSGCPDAKLLELADRMEEKIQQFYLDATDKIKLQKTEIDVFKQLGQAHHTTQKQLQMAI
ncbi:MAG: ferritin-like domain-containing protein [Candidatus Thorarchaeota archaeon]